MFVEVATMTSRWGDLPVLPDTDSGIAAIEREQMTKPRPMEVEGPPLHQPSSKHCPPSNEYVKISYTSFIYCRRPARWVLQQTTLAPGSEETRARDPLVR